MYEALESELKSLKAKVEVIDRDVRDIPDIINAGFRQMDSRFARVLAEMADMRRTMEARFDATLDTHLPLLPRLFAPRLARPRPHGAVWLTWGRKPKNAHTDGRNSVRVCPSTALPITRRKQCVA